MPFEVMVVIVVSVLAGTFGLVAVAKMIVSAVERRRLPAASDNSLSRRELSELIGDAVREATSPLYEEIEALRRQLPSGDDQRLLEAHPDDDR